MGCTLVIAAFIVTVIIVLKLWCFWNKSKVCLVGKTAVVTGGASGIGYETALSLAANGCRVIIPARDVRRASKAVEKIINETHNPHVLVKELELQSFKSVREFVKDLISTEERIDILICNAATGEFGDEKQTEDGLQITMQTNYFSHFLLIHLLLDFLKKSKSSRIIFTSSFMAYLSTLTINTLNPNTKYFYKWTTKLTGGCYSNSKLAMLAATKMFGKKLKGTGITVNAVHPGGVNTAIYLKGFERDKSKLIWSFGCIIRAFGKNCEAGAQTIIYLAQSNTVLNVTGKFFAEGIKAPMPLQLSNDFCQEIWDKSIEYAKLATDEVKC